MHAEWARGWLKIRVDKTCENVSVGAFLTDTLRVPEPLIRKMTGQSLIRINRQTSEPGSMLKAGQMLHLADPADLATRADTNVPSSTAQCGDSLRVLYEDDHLLVVNKAAGMIVHSDNRNEWTLDHQVAAYYHQSGLQHRVLHVHRLDKPTTGAVMYAKHGLAARSLDAQLRNHMLHRVYLAITYGAKWPQQSEVQTGIGRDRHRGGLYRVSSTGKAARTYVTKVSESKDETSVLSLIGCRLDTGRTHQIRVHAAHQGAPILGDRDYGGLSQRLQWPPMHAIALHAARLSFQHPYQLDKVDVNCPVDDGWMTFLRQEWGIDSQTRLAERLPSSLSLEAKP